MKQIVLNLNDYDKKFIYKAIPNLYIKILSDKIADLKKSDIAEYINRDYNISLPQILSNIKKCLYLKRYYNFVIIEFDKNISIDGKTKTITLLNIIDCGNRSIRGTNIVTDATNYILNNLRNLRQLYILQRGIGKLWE